MAAMEEHVLLAQPDKLAFLAEIPAKDSRPTATFRLLVEQSYRAGGGGEEEDDDAEDVDTVEDETCSVTLADLGCQGAVDRAFQGLVAGLHNPMLRPEVAPEARKAAARVSERCAGRAAGELGGVEFRLRVVLVEDAFEEESDSGSESGSDMDFGCGAFGLGDPDGAWYDQTVVDDDDGSQCTARPYHGALMEEGGPSDGTLLLSGFEMRSDGPEFDDQHELTARDMRRLVRLALNGGDIEDDEMYQRALAGGTPVSRATRAAMLDQALQSLRLEQQQQPTPPRPSLNFPKRTGF